MGYIDCDAHLWETGHTWDFLDPAERDYRPVTLRMVDSGIETFAVSDQRLPRGDRVQPMDPDKYHAIYPAGADNLDDVPARLAHLDRLGIDVQVLFSTFFIQANFTRPLVEASLVRSWNRWMAERTADSGGRLRWACRVPLLMPERAFEEMEFAKAHGATAIHVQGQAHGMVLDDEYLDPIWAKAQDLDLAVGVHVGLDATIAHRDPRSTLTMVTQVAVAFHRLAVSNLSERFPRLRWSFVESGSSWIPFALQEAARGTNIMLRRLDDNTEIETGLLERKNLYVACQIEDDLPYIVRFAGENNLIVGTDYGHLDIGADVNAAAIIANRTDLPPGVARKIVDDNGRRLHGIDPSFTPSELATSTV
jgi:predicted TIM-barrel fold metal-dependent hydrolase